MRYALPWWKGFIESDYKAYQTAERQRSVGNWVKAGAFAEEMRECAEATQCMSHQATHKKGPSTCYGALFYYLENCELTDPMISKSTNLCHLDAMRKRVDSAEAFERFKQLAEKADSPGLVWHIVDEAGGFPHYDGYQVGSSRKQSSSKVKPDTAFSRMISQVLADELMAEAEAETDRQMAEREAKRQAELDAEDEDKASAGLELGIGLGIFAVVFLFLQFVLNW